MSAHEKPLSTSARTASVRTLPRCEDLDLDALAYGELAPVDERVARSHVELCQPCREAHEQLVSERHQFRARARAAQPAALPSFDQLIARAEREPVAEETRWQALLRSWSAPWRGAVLQGAVGMFAIGMLVQVAILRPPRATESARPRSNADAVDRGPATTLDPWGESVVADACQVEVCADVDLPSNAEPAPVADACAGVQASNVVTVDWSLQSSFPLDGSVDAVCAPDAI